jgi:hypothetical protein
MKPEPYDIKVDNKAAARLANHSSDKTRPPRVVLRVTTDDIERVAEELHYQLTPGMVAEMESMLLAYKDRLIENCFDYIVKF